MTRGVAGTVRFIWPGGYVSEGTGQITFVSIGEDGNPGLYVRWAGHRPGATRWTQDSYCPRAEWLSRDGEALTPFRVSMEWAGCYWTGDVRETAAWHAEAPDTSGWWDGRGEIGLRGLTGQLRRATR